MENMTAEDRAAIKSNIARVLSDIFSAKYDCKITFRFEPKNPQGSENNE